MWRIIIYLCWDILSGWSWHYSWGSRDYFLLWAVRRPNLSQKLGLRSRTQLTWTWQYTRNGSGNPPLTGLAGFIKGGNPRLIWMPGQAVAVVYNYNRFMGDLASTNITRLTWLRLQPARSSYTRSVLCWTTGLTSHLSHLVLGHNWDTTSTESLPWWLLCGLW